MIYNKSSLYRPNHNLVTTLESACLRLYGKTTIDYNDLRVNRMNGTIFENVSFLNEGYLDHIKRLAKEVEEIKKDKPDRYSSKAEAKEYIDRNYNDIMKAIKILEEEPKKIRKDEVNAAIQYLIGFVASALTAACPVLYIILTLAIIIIYIIKAVMIAKRRDISLATMRDISSVKSSLNRIKNRKDLDNKTKRSIDKLIDSIEDVERIYDEYKEDTKVNYVVAYNV